MKYVTINQGSSSTVNVLASDTTTTLLAGVEINVEYGAAINAASGATDRNIVVNGIVTSTMGDGIDIGIQNKAGDFVGGGNLDIGADAMVTGGMTGVAVLADGETINNQGKITSAGTALLSEGAHLTLDNSGTISGDKFGAALVGARSLLTNDGTISSTAGSGVELSGNHTNAINNGTISGHLFGVEFAQGAQHEVHLFTNNGTVHGDGEAIEGSGDRENHPQQRHDFRRRLSARWQRCLYRPQGSDLWKDLWRRRQRCLCHRQRPAPVVGKPW